MLPTLLHVMYRPILKRYDILKGLKKGGTFLLNSIWDVEDYQGDRLPDDMKKYLAENEIKFYLINATQIAEDLGLGNRTNSIMQAAFFKTSSVIPYEMAVKEMKKAIIKSYGMKGEEIVRMNHAAIDKGGEVTQVDVPKEWKNLKITPKKDDRNIPEFIKNVVEPINAQRGDNLPVSAFIDREDGTFPAGTSQYEKRGIAVHVPEWIPENCIQCNQCSYVCPHAVIRPFLLTEEEVKKAPKGTKTVTGLAATKEYQYRMQISPLDCTGCGNCVDVCPAKSKALVMETLESQMVEDERWHYMHEKVGYKDWVLPKEKTVKNSQFAQPLFEFSGACAGCGETPYIKLITQLYGERMMIANATGCSSIYGGSAPSMPYTVNKDGHGPSWANSLFEDNAEYGYGMAVGVNEMRKKIANYMRTAIQGNYSKEIKEAFAEWIEGMDNAGASKAASGKVISLIKKDKDPLMKEIMNLRQYLVKKSVWIFGGDGWAYDIGYGGLDHVIASGEDVNILVMDTEVYSNTGGQASKSTPIGAIAKFAASGKRIRKKDLGMMAVSYGYVYVAQVALGASQSQYLKAVKEAEEFPGPSLIIAYSPCINHGLKAGMGKTIEQSKLAVESGYWHLYRYNPMIEKEGKNPFQLDSKEPQWDNFQKFIGSEVRYSSLSKAFPEVADELFKAAEENARWRYNSYRRMSEMDFSKV
jgi:pyruvate-ferredoxin/flavodoxin oxidoreductase